MLEWPTCVVEIIVFKVFADSPKFFPEFFRSVLELIIRKKVYYIHVQVEYIVD